MADQAPMNIVILMGDQHRWDALGCAAEGLEPWQRTWLMNGPAGRPLVRTPHLDRLAATGVRFSQAAANLPVCVPCRHSFITGMYPHQIGILTNAHYWPYDPPVPTLPMYLRDAGYTSASIGKMHWKSRNAPDEHVPDKRGFDFRAGRGGNTDGPNDVSMAGTVQTRDQRLRAAQVSRFGVGGESREGYAGDVSPQPAADLAETWLVNQAVDYLQKHQRASPDRPFCLLVSLDRPHPPNVIPADYDGMYDPAEVPLPPRVADGFHEDDPHLRRQIVQRGWAQMDERELRLSVSRYLTNVTYVDDCLGKVLAALDELGYADNTLVVLLSDHGEMLGERAGAHTKYCLYDSAVRVPLIVRWPGLNQAGLVSHAPVELVDLMPTWLDAARLDPAPYLPGRSLRPLLEGKAPESVAWREATLAEQYTPATEEPGRPRGPRGQWMIRENRYKLIHRAGARSALYDLREDPNELYNLIDESSLAPVRDRLRARIVQGVIARAEQYPSLHEPEVLVARPPAAAAAPVAAR